MYSTRAFHVFSRFPTRAVAILLLPAVLVFMALGCGGEPAPPGGDATPQSTAESRPREREPGSGSAGANTPEPTSEAAPQPQSTSNGANTPEPTNQAAPQQSSTGTGVATPEPTNEATPQERSASNGTSAQSSRPKEEPCPAPPAAPSPPAQTSVETDREALVAFFNATNGESWDDSGLWASRRPLSEWPGVTTDNDGRVVGLDLSENQVSGEIPAELGNLSSLERLYLYRNQLSGEIPAELGNLLKLRGLLLADNQLSGEIPAELGNLLNLTDLNLYANQLSGEIPCELGNLVNLKSLALGKAQLSGEIPAELGNLVNLTWLNLSDNRLSGEIPAELGNLAHQTGLVLANNQLSGEIPAEFDRPWRELALAGNQFSGCVSDFLRDLVRISYPDDIPICDVSDPGDEEALVALYNALGSPDSLGNWLGREPIGEWKGVSVNRKGRVVGLNLSGMQEELAYVTEEMPPEFYNLTGLTMLWLRDDWLSGEVDEDRWVVRDISRGLCLRERPDTLYGFAPPCQEREALNSIAQAYGFSTFNSEMIEVRTNKNGHVVGLETTRRFQDLGGIPGSSFHEGDLSEIVPWLNNLSNLRFLEFYRSHLTGEIPPELGNLSNLEVLDLTGNHLRSWLSGKIPPELGNLSHLRHLDLSNNQLSGEIPPELGNLSNLESLNLSDNQLSGEIPAELGNLSHPTLYLGGNQLSGCVPSGLYSGGTGLPNC